MCCRVKQQKGESFSNEQYYHFLRVVLLRVNGYRQAEQAQPQGREQSAAAQSHPDNERSVKAHKLDAHIVAANNDRMTFVNEIKPIECQSRVSKDLCVLTVAARDNFANAGNDDQCPLPQIICTLLSYGGVFELRAVATGGETSLVGMPLVASYTMPRTSDAQIDVSEWIGMLDAMLVVVPYAAQLPLVRQKATNVALSTPFEVQTGQTNKQIVTLSVTLCSPLTPGFVGRTATEQQQLVFSVAAPRSQLVHSAVLVGNDDAQFAKLRPRRFLRRLSKCAETVSDCVGVVAVAVSHARLAALARSDRLLRTTAPTTFSSSFTTDWCAKRVAKSR